MENAKKRLKKKILMSIVFTTIVITLVFLVGTVSLFAQEKPNAAPTAPAGAEKPAAPQEGDVKKFAFIAAALAFGFGALAAGIAVGNVGSAAMGAIGEKPEIAGQAIIFVALAEGLAVFGLIIAILILGRV